MSDATSVDPTAVLFGLEEEFSVLSVRRIEAGAVRVIVEQTAREGPCPACGVLSSTIKDRPLMRLRDLPAFGQPVQLWWRKRRLVCAEAECPTRTFTQTASAVRPRGRGPSGCGTGSRPRSRRGTGRCRRWPPSTVCRGRPRTAR